MKFAGEQSCHKYCENSCRTPRDGVCQDHWPCRLGSDCADCGVRVMCKPRGTSLLLPRAILSPAGAPPLTVDKVLFVVFGSARLRAKSERAHETWCSVHGANCLFVLDEHGATEHELDHSSLPALPLLRVSAARPPAHCCPARRRRRLKQAAGGAPDPHAHLFFCEPHRAVTLPAQYRFLPALQHVAASPAFTGGKFRFVVLVDDDSYVFVRRLLWLLSRIDHKRPLYLGDFGASPEAILLGVKRFACGGGGSVLTAGALRRMDLAACTRRYHAMCMQSDWMIGGCAMSYNVTALGELGCNTCDQRYNAGRVKAMLKADRCFFSQIAEKYAADLPLGARAPAILHKIGDDKATEAFFRKNAARENRSRYARAS